MPTVTQFANTNFITIPEIGPATPYPSIINVSGLSNVVGKVTVTLNQFSHTFSDDVSVLLVGPANSGGQKVLLMSHVGGQSGTSDAVLTFDESASGPLPQSSQIVSGTYLPSPYGTVNWPTNTPPSPYEASLAVFNGSSANGAWSLYVYDGSAGDAGNIADGWSLAVTTIQPVNQVVDLAVTGTSAPNPVLEGNNLTYTFSITNNGPNTAPSGIAFTNILPAGVTFVSASSPQGVAATNAAGAVYCTLTNSLPVGTNATITVVVAVNPGTTTLSSTATVTTSQTDLNLANNSVAVTTTVNAPLADLALGMVGPLKPVVVGSNLTYAITVTNNGPATAFGVVVTNPLPSGLAFAANLSSSTLGTVTNVSGVVSCNLGNMANGASAVITIVAIPQQAGSFTNQAGASTLSNDTNALNNFASLVLTAANPAPNIVSSGASLLTGNAIPQNGGISPGETVMVSLSLSNNGSADTTNLQAVLLNTGGVTSLSSPQTYGQLIHGGTSVANNFSFTANSAAGGTVVATLQLSDGGTALPPVSFGFNLSTANSYANGGAIIIPEIGAGSPYPSTINISGLTGLVSQVTVTLSNLSHTFPSDIGAILVSPSGQASMLMAAAGAGYAVTNVTLTFDDSASSTLPASGQIIAGTFQPSSYNPNYPFAPPAPAGPNSASLAAFNGTSPNGTWSLFVYDDRAGDSGLIADGWNLNVATVSPLDPLADLGLTVSSPVGAVVAGQTFAYTLTVTNAGPAAGSGIVVTNFLPTGLSFVSASAPGGYSNSGGVVTLNFGSIPVNSSANATLTVNASAIGVYTNIAVVTGAVADLNQGNNTVAVNTVVLAPSAAPSLGTPAFQGNGAFTMTLTGQPLQTYAIYASTNLVNWGQVSTITLNSSGISSFTDTNVGSFAYRFYRAFGPIPTAP
jgi:uncharacterized repeat protein (TIGR01451 family)